MIGEREGVMGEKEGVIRERKGEKWRIEGTVDDTSHTSSPPTMAQAA